MHPHVGHKFAEARDRVRNRNDPVGGPLGHPLLKSYKNAILISRIGSRV